MFICCARTYIFSSSFSSSSLLLNNGSWQASKGGNTRSHGSTSAPLCPSSSPRVRGNYFLSLWMSCINPLNMQGYLSCCGTSANRLDNNGLYILLGPRYLHLHLHTPSRVRISRILSMKGRRPKTYILKPRLW